MRLLDRVSSMFRRPSGPRRAGPFPVEVPDSGTGTSTAAAAPGAEAPDEAQPGLVEVRPSAISAAAAQPRSRQEMMEELQRNYREVVELVRKLDTHLDQEKDRAAHLLAVARRIDAALPVIQDLPSTLRTHAESLEERIGRAIADVSAQGEARAERLESALAHIGERIEQGSAAQESLARTMAGFCETMSESGRASARTAEAVESLRTGLDSRDAEMVRMVASSRMWMLLGMGICLAVALAALAVAVVALTGAG